jgi:hypothetical protein
VHALRELLGRNSTDDALLFISDGGHHENLGVLPLLRRGCNIIIAVDAAADASWTFSDLARAIRLMRVDYGFEMEDLDISELVPQGRTLSDRCVRSPVALGTLRKGTAEFRFVYVKAALLAEAPLDVKEYAARHLAFPQQSTVNQFFDEAQFEAYRKLGECAAQRAYDAMQHDTACAQVLGLTPSSGQCS